MGVFHPVENWFFISKNSDEELLVTPIAGWLQHQDGKIYGMLSCPKKIDIMPSLSHVLGVIGVYKSREQLTERNFSAAFLSYQHT